MNDKQIYRSNLFYEGCCREIDSTLVSANEVDIFISDLNSLTIEVVLDIWTEKADDSVKHKKVTRQNKFDKF